MDSESDKKASAKPTGKFSCKYASSLWNFSEKVDHFKNYKATRKLESKYPSWDEKVFPFALKEMFVTASEIMEPDMVIKIGDKHFECSHLVLSTFSNYFKNIAVRTKEVILPPREVPAEAFEFIYYWMREDKPRILVRILLKAYLAAKYLGVQKLIDQIWYHFNNPHVVTEGLAFKIYLGSKKMGMSTLGRLMLSRVSKYFLVAVSSPEYVKMPVDDICYMLSMNQVGVCCEIEVFYAAVRWLSYDWEAREKDILKVVKHVRFGLIPTKLLVELHANPEEIYEKITSNKEVSKMLLNGLTTNSVGMEITKPGELAELLTQLNIAQPVHRTWVFDKYAKHHHKADCPEWKNVKYQDFVLYLSRLQADRCSWKEIRFVEDNRNIPCCAKLPSLYSMIKEE